MFHEPFSFVPFDPSVSQGLIALAAKYPDPFLLSVLILVSSLAVFSAVSLGLLVQSFGQCPNCGSRKRHREMLCIPFTSRYHGRTLVAWIIRWCCDACGYTTKSKLDRFDCVVTDD